MNKISMKEENKKKHEEREQKYNTGTKNTLIRKVQYAGVGQGNKTKNFIAP